MSLLTKILLLSLILTGSIGCFNGPAGAMPPDTIAEIRQKKIQIDNVEILLDLATKVYSGNPERSLNYAETALDIAQKQHIPEYEIKALNIIGNIYKKLDYDKLALPRYRSAYELALVTGNARQIKTSYKLLGEIYYKLEVIDSASFYFNQYLNASKATNNKDEIADATLLLGNTFWYRTNYDKALEFYFRGLKIFEEVNDRKGMATAYNKIGSLYSAIGDKRNSMIYLQKAMQYFTSYDVPESLSELYFRLGIAFKNDAKNDSALYYFNLAKILLDSLRLERKSAYIDKYKANIYFEQGYTQKAIEIAKSALGVFQQKNYKWGIVDVYNDLALYNINLGDYTTASDYLKKSLKLTKEINSLELLKTIYLNYSKLYSAQHDFAQALKSYQKYQSLNDSSLNREKNTRIAELQARYENTRKETELKQKTEEISRNIEQIQKQRRNLYMFGISTFLILLMSFGLYRQYRLLSQKGKKIERINTELDHRVKERTSALRLTQFSIEHAADAICWMDPRGNFVYANNSACNILGYSKEEILLKSIQELIPKFQSTDWNDIWDYIREKGSEIIETNFRNKSKQAFPVEITMNYIYHDQKEYAFAFIRDISDRKMREENLRKAKENAEEADKLKSAFLANMSHEIRTPMNAIIGFSDLLINNEIPEEDKPEFADIIKHSSETLLKLIDDIIDISLIEAGQLKINQSHFHLNTVLKEIVRFYQEEKVRLNKPQVSIRLNENNFDDTIFLNTDQIRFRQIITNLMGNAMKFTENGFIELGYYKVEGHKIKIYVQDTGIGIPEEKISMIFERFSKLQDHKKLYGGTGLGLAISKKLTEQMNGDISVHSEIDKGSTFEITLNYETGNPAVPNKNNVSSNGKFRWNHKSLLIVEDVESNYQYLETLLKKTGIRIHWAKDGEQAVEYCSNIRPDMVLMDIQLPIMNGYEVTRIIRDKYPDLPIIAQTAFAFSEEKNKIIQAGCVDYVIKPIDRQHLYETMNKYLT